MKRILSLLLLILVSFTAFLNLDACGPYLPIAVFETTLHPDLPLEPYAAGNLGVLQSTYPRSYLYTAYRLMMAAPFSAEEQNQLVRLWKNRLRIEFPGTSNDAQVWLDARAKTDGITEVQVDGYKEIDYQSFRNCNADAFSTAAATLQDRSAKFGNNSAAVREWLTAQDQVFANCAGGDSPVIPAPASAALPALLRSDRAYQVAAAYFYGGNYPEARKRFEEIAHDSASPWSKTARYLSLRAMIRQGTVGAGLDNPPDLAVLDQALQQLRQLSSEFQKSPDAGLAPAVQRLMEYLRYRIDPAGRARELAPLLLKNSDANSLYQNLWDYTMCLDRLSPEQTRADDLTLWLFTFQAEGTDALNTSLDKWKQSGSVPWLVSAISKVPASHEAVPALMSAAEKIPKDSPAYLTLTYHRARLLIDSGKQNDARALLDAFVGESKNDAPPSSLNRILSLRMKLATNLDDFLKFAQRVPSAVGFDYSGLEVLEQEEGQAPAVPTLIDEDGAALMNGALSLEVLQQASHSKAVDDDLRKRVTKAVWVRAILLDQMDVAVQMIPEIQPLLPNSSELFKAMGAASDPVEARFGAVYLLLKNPGLEPQVRAGLPRETAVGEIDNFRDNWWCAVQNNPSFSEFFLDPATRAAASEQMETLASLGPAPNFLAEQAITWAGAHRDDPRSPEALHLVVKSTRYGCTDKRTKAYSKEAFQLLHKNWPDSEWAKKTPYFY